MVSKPHGMKASYYDYASDMRLRTSHRNRAAVPSDLVQLRQRRDRLCLTVNCEHLANTPHSYLVLNGLQVCWFTAVSAPSLR